MASVETLSCPPDLIEQDTTVRFSHGNSDHPATAWTAQFVLNNGVNQQSFTGTASGTEFTFVLSAAETASLPPGEYTYGFLFTAISPTTEKAIADIGVLNILPSLLIPGALTDAQTMVANLKTALASLGSSKFSSVSVDGQSYTRANMAEYRGQLVQWEARVIAEQERFRALRGQGGRREINVMFA